jgi:hypothetical protein
MSRISTFGLIGIDSNEQCPFGLRRADECRSYQEEDTEFESHTNENSSPNVSAIITFLLRNSTRLRFTDNGESHSPQRQRAGPAYFVQRSASIAERCSQCKPCGAAFADAKLCAINSFAKVAHRTDIYCDQP